MTSNYKVPDLTAIEREPLSEEKITHKCPLGDVQGTGTAALAFLLWFCQLPANFPASLLKQWGRASPCPRQREEWLHRARPAAPGRTQSAAQLCSCLEGWPLPCTVLNRSTLIRHHESNKSHANGSTTGRKMYAASPPRLMTGKENELLTNQPMIDGKENTAQVNAMLYLT